MDRNTMTELEIEMFGKARELQAMWLPRRGDWFYKADGLGQGLWLICTRLGGTLFCAGEGMHNEVFKSRLVEFRNPQNYTWIPSVESLLAMVGEIEYTIGHRIKPPSYWELVFSEFNLAADSLRLLLLGMVMHEKFDQSWQGNTWRKLKKSKK